MRRPGAVVGFIALTLLGSAVIAVAARLPGHEITSPLRPACQVRTASGVVALDSDQMANSATIAAVGLRRRMPERAIVVALAAALQESRLRNLAHGDRDSVGLFQQRPSQGWGTVDQILDPRYAAGRFYSALARVRGWEQMRVTQAAQRVQRSAYPEAYERWRDQAMVLAEALAGRATSAVACTGTGQPAIRGSVAARALGAGLRLDWGDVPTVSVPTVIGLVVAPADDRVGWQYAHWLVAHSAEKSVQRVSFGDREWTAERGDWAEVGRDGKAAGLGGGERVIAEVYRP